MIRDYRSCIIDADFAERLWFFVVLTPYCYCRCFFFYIFFLLHVITEICTHFFSLVTRNRFVFTWYMQLLRPVKSRHEKTYGHVMREWMIIDVIVFMSTFTLMITITITTTMNNYLWVRLHLWLQLRLRLWWITINILLMHFVISLSSSMRVKVAAFYVA